MMTDLNNKSIIMYSIKCRQAIKIAKKEGDAWNVAGKSVSLHKKSEMYGKKIISHRNTDL